MLKTSSSTVPPFLVPGREDMTGRRLDRARRLRVPRSLTDLAGLKVDAEDFLAAVLETAAQPIWVVDPDGLIRFANPAAIAALGYDGADELFGRDSHETIHYRHPDGTPYPAAECPMLLPRATGRDGRSDLDWFFRRDGSMFPVSYVSVPIELRGGPWRRRGLHRHRGPPARRAGAARARRGACSARGRAAADRGAGGRRGGVGGGVRRHRQGGGPRAGRRAGRGVALRARRDGDRSRRLERASASVPGRHPLAARRTDDLRRASWTPAAPRGSTTSPTSAGTIADAARASRDPLVRRRPDHRRRRRVGRDGGRSGRKANRLPDRHRGSARRRSRSWSPRRSRTARAGRSSPGSRTSRPRCGAWRRWSPAASRRPRCSRRSRVRSACCSVSTRRTWRATSLDGTATGVAAWSPAGDHKPVGTRVDTEGESIVGIVLRTGAARADAQLRASVRRCGRTGPGAGPALVGRRPDRRRPAPLGRDDRLLEGRPAAPAWTRSRGSPPSRSWSRRRSRTPRRGQELAASRARIVAATDEERRRVVRDLHDGAQQRLVHTIITLQAGAPRLPETRRRDAPALLTEALDHAEQATAELRELAHGILPAVLTQGGLRAGVEALASRMPVPVETDASVWTGCPPRSRRPPTSSSPRRSRTSRNTLAPRRAAVTARVEDGTLRVQVRDDGVGGARPDGSGLRRAGGPACRPRRPAPGREPGRRRHARRRGHPARRLLPDAHG